MTSRMIAPSAAANNFSMVVSPARRSPARTAIAEALSKRVPRIRSSVVETESSADAFGTRVQACHRAVPGRPATSVVASVTMALDVTDPHDRTHAATPRTIGLQRGTSPSAEPTSSSTSTASTTTNSLPQRSLHVLEPNRHNRSRCSTTIRFTIGARTVRCPFSADPTSTTTQRPRSPARSPTPSPHTADRPAF